jgi:hypothetical protein
MQLIICLLIAAEAALVRIPEKTLAPTIESREVWVFLNDKGIYNQADYGAAIRTMERHTTASVSDRRSTRPDFNDIPVRETYIREIEELGGRLRTVSKWLNAASFDMPPALVAQVYSLPFVYDMKPVASRATTEADFFPLTRVTATSQSRSLDTAYARRFYGPSYDQAQMMGVPNLFFRGYFGSNVRLAIFDTGIKLTNRAISRARIYKQYDFISGDNCYAARSNTSWQPAAVDNIRFLGFARGLALRTIQAQSGSRDTLLMTFCADSFAYGYNAPRRAILASSSTDGGSTWISPLPLVMSPPAGQTSAPTFENLTMAGRGSVTYLTYNQLTPANRAPAAAGVYLGYFTDTNWHGNPELIAPGRYPAVAVLADTLYLAFVQSDSLVVLWKASVASPEPESLLATTFTSGEPLAGLQIAAGTNGVTDIITTELKSGRITQFRTTDGGVTFAKLSDPVAAGAARTRLIGHGPQRLLVYEDQSQSVLSSLAALSSDDDGLTWKPTGTITDSVFSIGGFDLVSETPSGVTLAYETGGFLYRTASTDFGSTWSAPALIESTGFNAMPALTTTGDGSLALWFKRGDDSAVWQTADTAKFSTEQPYHGTRMASIIAGYQQGGVIGIAPGVDLLIAKTELYKVRSGRFYEYNMEEDAYIEALEWADRMGADVISTSLGYRNWYGDNQFDGKTAPISIAASIAAKRGLLIVTAMGNRDSSAYPWPEPYIVAPGDADGVITAGGVEKSLLAWRGTGTGPTSDGRTKPDLVALSDTVAVVSPDSEDYLDGSVGTSCATDLIAGACALLKEAHPQWSADSIKAVLFATASRSVKSCTFGFGVPRVDSAYKLFPPERSIVDVPGDEIGVIFPNPFVPASQSKVYFPINLTRPAPEASISIFSVSGALIDTITLNATVMPRPGRYGVNGDVATLERIGAYWDGRNAGDKPVAAGLYTAVLQTTFGRSTTRFALVR